jgi:hypothetical protein
MNSQLEAQTISRDSSDVVAELEEHVRWRLHGRVRDLHLDWNQHGLVVRGRSRTYYAKQLAQEAVMKITDLPVVANEIEVS